jgi:GTP-sensing pleiotropic transcriptional regulator CodY
MQFGNYLNEYMKLKRLRGVTPTTAQAQQILSPYFDAKARANIEGQKLNLQEKEVNFNNQKATEQLAYQKWLANQEMALARKADRNSTFANILGTGASLGGLFLLKNSPITDRGMILWDTLILPMH